MIIILDSGKELTIEEVKEVVDKFQGLLGDGKERYIPYPIIDPQPIYPTIPTYYGPIITCFIGGGTDE